MPEQIQKAVILVNLGTPAVAEVGAIRRFLKQFLSDRRVVELPRLLWYPILYGIILPFRARRLVADYVSILDEDGKLPLQRYSESIRDGLQARLAKRELRVELAMTYGSPSLAEVYRKLAADGVQRIGVLPLFPQYSATTTAAVIDQLSAVTAGLRAIPSTAWVSEYASRPEYIDGLAGSVREHWQKCGKSSPLVVSFHGIPQRNVDLGDPYETQCRSTVERLAQALDLPADEVVCCFQSRLGRAQWLQPYAIDTVKYIAKNSGGRIDVISPAFAAECLETLEEINVELREEFINNGGEEFHYIPCLNDSEAQLDLLQAVIEDHF